MFLGYLTFAVTSNMSVVRDNCKTGTLKGYNLERIFVAKSSFFLDEIFNLYAKYICLTLPAFLLNKMKFGPKNREV